MATAKKKAEVVEMKPIEVKYLTIKIVGDTDLRLHRMDAVNRQALIDKQRGKESKSKKVSVDKWMQAISTLRWRDGDPTEYTEEAYKEAIENNAPCISSFGLKKSIGQAVTRLGFETYSTNFNASLQIVDELIPIKFTECVLEEQLVPAPTGSPILGYINQFKGWSAEFEIRYIENYYSLEQLLNFIKYSGFSIGIGSGRPGKSASNYGTYHIEEIR